MHKRINASAALLSLVLVLTGAFIARAQHKNPPLAPIDLNTATVEELQQLPSIGPQMAKEIVEFRMKSGPFRRVEDLLAIHGISQRKLDEIRPYVTVGAAKQSKP